MLVFESCINRGHLFEHVYVVFWEHSDPAEVFERFGSLVANQPTWGFFDEEQADEHHASGDELYREWNDPLRVILFHCGRNTVLKYSQLCLC
jgi:hypothetical protein